MNLLFPFSADKVLLEINYFSLNVMDEDIAQSCEPSIVTRSHLIFTWEL